MKDIVQILELANKIAPPARTDNPPDLQWNNCIAEASVPTLIGVACLLNPNPGSPAEARRTLRESLLAEIDRKNAVQLAETMGRLDAATTSLNKRMYALSAAGVVLAVAQVIVALL
jgi:hypothetical protein